MKLEELMNTHYLQLNENDHSVLQNIIKHQSDYAAFSCEQMAKACHISRATLLRITHKLGLTSFSDLKLILKQEPIISTTDAIDMYDSFHTLIDELKKFSYHAICEVLFHCKTIYIYGTGNEQKALASEFKRIFLTVGKCVIDLFDEGEVAFLKDTFCKEDVFVIISLSGETKEGIAILKMLAATPIQTISITRLQNNTISSLCEQHLYVATKTIKEYELVSAFYVLIDLLFIHYLDYQKELKQ